MEDEFFGLAEKEEKERETGRREAWHLYTHKPGCTDGREHPISHLAPVEFQILLAFLKFMALV